MQPLERPVKLILWLQVALTAALLLVGFLESSGTGWEDLTRFLLGFMAVIYLVGVGAAWALARYAIRPFVLRLLAAVAVPGLLTWVVLFFISRT